ncbi:MAG: GMC family oxidoreductase N-terminal domain-containing protein [Acidimicrobiia bacterium]
MLGGSSSINGQVWTRGNAADYDEWASLGCDGWDYRSVLPYFKRSEHFAAGGDEYRGGRGPVSVSYPRFDHRLTDAFIDASQQAGIPFNPDFNGRVQDGVGRGQLSQKRGFRHSTARAYLVRARLRPNLTLRKHALVTRIVVDDSSRATGVEFEADGRNHRVEARREVILCAGAIASPKMLMLSGIGPKATLAEHGLDLVLDSPEVGRNLQEHIYTSMVFNVNVSTLNVELNPKGIAKHGLDFVFRGRGAVTVAAAHAMVFDRLSPASTRPDFEVIFAPMGLSGSAPAADAGEGIEYRHDVHELRPMTVSTCMTLPSVCHPRARGVVTLHSGDPHAKPKIVHELLADPADIRDLTAVCRRVREVMAQDAMRPYLVGEMMPGPAVETDDQWEQYLRGFAWRGEHPIGTCRMGSDEQAVVDPQLRVRGIDGLRVVDASVMPTLISGHTNAPTVMIAERASDLIRGSR